MVKLVAITLFCISLFAYEDKDVETEKLFKYKYLNINDTISVYAAEVFMNDFEDENVYSVGLLLNAETKSDAEFGVGYIKTAHDVQTGHQTRSTSGHLMKNIFSTIILA